MRLEPPAQGIRATVIGASQYTTQVSGSTIFVSPHSALPLRNVPVIAPSLLLEGDRPLRLGSRALAILAVLVERPGALIGKEDLVARVWPDTFVEEGNLRVHMAALRRTLGDGQGGNRYIATIPGRGYRFVAQVSLLAGPEPAAATRIRAEYRGSNSAPSLS